MNTQYGIEDQLFTVQEAAELLRMRPSEVLRLLKRRALSHYQFDDGEVRVPSLAITALRRRWGHCGSL